MFDIQIVNSLRDVLNSCHSEAYDRARWDVSKTLLWDALTFLVVCEIHNIFMWLACEVFFMSIYYLYNTPHYRLN